MFESLDDQMKHDAQAEASTKERMLKYVLIGVVSVVVVCGIFAVQFIKQIPPHYLTAGPARSRA